MPRLTEDARERRKVRIEEAATELFIAQGYHGTTMREIAGRARVSLGNLYNYYPTKEQIFQSIIHRYQRVIDARLRAIFEEVKEPLLPENLTTFARRVKELVNDHADYWRLMYIDVLEFQNRHFRKMFENLARNLRRQFRHHFQALERSRALWDGVDPAVGFTAAYMQFFNYFLVEKLFGGHQHFGLSDDRVIARLTDIFTRGILRPEGLRRLRRERARSSPRSGKEKKPTAGRRLR